MSRKKTKPKLTPAWVKKNVTAPVTAAPKTPSTEWEFARLVAAHNDGQMEGYMAGLRAPRTAGEAKAKIMRPSISAVLADVARELEKAYTKFPRRQSSPHEGYAVLLEETDELFDEIKADRGRLSTARHEAIQAAAMAVRFILDNHPGPAR